MIKPKKIHRYILQLLVGLLLLNILVIVVKNVVKQPRPTTILKDYSFPSQHSANAFFLATFVAILPIWQSKRKTKQFKTLTIIGLYLIAALVAYSRIFINVHYWPDVIIGSIIGAIIALISRRL